MQPAKIIEVANLNQSFAPYATRQSWMTTGRSASPLANTFDLCTRMVNVSNMPNPDSKSG